ncbi:MAG: arylsulfate sulfotransferase N-terminal domain-containing protein, partial [Lachnospiraceae bacterium]|nr:arylsulfate sulfotransferase N-terminal domain-containing protein [Lachnospiraceae bacterium]
MKNKVLLSRLCICTLTVSLLAGCSSAGSTSETANNSETESISSETASESESATTASASFASLEKTDLFEQQNSIDEALQQEASAGYSFEEPNVIVNPYGNSPLTAVAAFHTDKELGGTVTVKGKDEKNDITGTFEAATDHLVPIYGLYNGDTTEVVLTLEDGTSTTVEVTTEKTEINVGTIETTMSDDSAYDYSNLTFVCSSA